MVLSGLIGMAVAVYFYLMIAPQRFRGTLDEMMYPLGFFGGACAVYLLCSSMHYAARDLGRLTELECEARTDAMMGIRNRRYFDRRLGLEVEAARLTGSPLSCLMLDLDHFKRINDTWGHPVGDAVLAALGGLLSEKVRHRDTLARYGGEEVVVLAPDTDCEEAECLAERLRCSIEADLVGRVEWPGLEEPPRLSVSIGHATLWGRALDGGRLVRTADGALYRAKREGRNRVEGAPLTGSTGPLEPDRVRRLAMPRG
jgi:diguanylate cyclase (GGDEF)-like protein